VRAPGYRLSVTATGSAPLRKATLYWKAPDLDRAAMGRDARTATTEVRGLRTSVTWWVEAEATDGRTFTTREVTTANPC
jgi:hypothetical protein